MTVDASVRARLDAFGDLLRRWNRVYNLVSRHDIAHLEAKHVQDSLALVPWVRGTRIADVGSGAGFPGIPLAIVGAEWSVTLVERSARKARFLRQALIEMDIGNATVVEEDVRRYRPATPFDTVTVRAFAKPPVAWEAIHPLLGPGGVALLQTGARLSGSELAGGRILSSDRVPSPGGGGERYVTAVTRAQSAPSPSNTVRRKSEDERS